MKPLIIKGTEYSPEIIFNPGKSLFCVNGESRPEDAGKLFGTVLKWLEEYLENTRNTGNTEPLKFEFNLLYFNTVSAKYILEIMRLLYLSHQEGRKIQIIWNYKEKDEDMREAGEEYERLVNLPFIFTKH